MDKIICLDTLLYENSIILIDALPDAIFIKDGHGRWLVTNESAKKLFKLSEIEWQNKTEDELAKMRPEFAAIHESCKIDDEKAWQKKSIIIAEERLYDDDGFLHIFEVRKVPVFDDNSNRKALVIIGRDVTDERNAIELAQRRLQDRALLLDAVGDGVYGVNDKGQCIFINKAATKMLGFSENETLGQNQHLLFHYKKIDGSDYPHTDCPVHHTIVDRQQRECDDWFITKNGIFFPVSLTITPLSDGGAIVVFKDITKIKEYENLLEKKVAEKTKELQELNENLEQRIVIEVEKNKRQDLLIQQQSRLAALGEMIGNIAHQWRQPLSSITTAITGLKIKQEYGMLQDDDIINTSEGIVRNANFLSQTIDDFRNFFKKDKIKEVFNVSQTIHNTFNIIKASFDANFITIEFDLDEAIEYDGFSSELSQVLLNIFNNAKDALIQNNIENKKVKITLKQLPKIIQIIISDNAGGVPNHIIDKIFDPYFTTKHQSQGTGLGLYMSAQIIRNNFDGEIYEINTVNHTNDGKEKGASFYIDLPISS